jgi:hypothetical protein
MEPTPNTTRPEWSQHPATAWLMLAIAVPAGGWLLWEIHTTIGLGAPRLWELLRTDRVFDLAMLDFVLTAGWASLIWIERANWRNWRAWVAFGIFFVIPSLGIVAFILLARTKRTKSPPNGENS